MRRAFVPLCRPVSLAVLLLGLAVAVPAAGGAGSKAPSQASKLQKAALRAEQRPGRELVALRTRTTKTFAGRRGERTMRLYTGSVHYRDRGGRWREIDTRLQRLHGRLLNRRNNFSTSLPLELGRDTVRVRKGRWWVGFALRGASGTATVHDGTARYRDALPGVDAVYTAQLDSVKEDLVLRGPGSQRRFAFDLSMPRGLRPDLLRSGGLVLRDRTERIRLSLGAPFMVDAKRRAQRVGSRLHRVPGGWRLSYALDDAWLDRPGRAWPVTVDPYIEPGPPNGGDCYLDASFPESSFCSANPMKVGMVGGHDHRIVMRFPLAAIPRGAEVSGATLVAWLTSEQTTTWREVAAEPLTEPFTSAASWNRNDGTDRWSEPGGEVDAGAKAENPDALGSGGGEGYWTMFKMVREWVSGKRPNHGMVLSVPGGGNGAWIDSAESVDHRPYLNIAYKERIGEKRGWVYERQRLTDRISLGVNVASGNLMVRQTDFQMPGGLGPAVSVSRSYNSLEDNWGALGAWLLDTGPDMQLAQWAGGTYMRLRYPSGSKGTYERDPATGKYKTPPGFNNTLEKDVPAAGKWQLTDHDSQTKYRFENYTKDGRLYEIEDRNGRKLTFVYNATSGRLERIEDANNDTATTTDDVRFTFANANQLTQMTDPAGRTYGYGYTGSDLTSFTDPQNGASFKTLYEYGGPNGELSKITTPQGNMTTIAYYPAGHEYASRVKSVTRVTDTATMTGPTTSFEYVIRRDGSGETRVTDPIGTATVDDHDRVTRHVFDEQGRVTKTFDALGRETSRKLTSNSNVESYTAASNTGTTPNTSFTYDSDDNPTRSDTPVASGSVRNCADFGAADAQPCDSAPSGYAGVPSGVSGSKYLPGRATNAQGGRTEFGWQDTGATDTNGNLHSVRQTTNSGTLVAGVSMSYAPTTSSVDGKKGQLSSITDGRGHATSYGYDAKGNVNLITPPNPGAPNPTGPTRLTYNLNLARVDKVQDAKDNWRLLTYDNLDRVTKIDFTGADQVLGATEPYVQYTYDRDGNQTQEVTREQGTGTLRTRTMTYDKLNRVTLESLPGGVSNAYTYDRVGNLRSLTDAGGKVEYTYNAVNEIRAVYDPAAPKPTKFEHNIDGLRTKTTYANGATMAQSYDGAFRLSEILSKDAAGTTAQKFNYAYKDPATSRETPMILEKVDGKLGQTTRYVYDGLDRLDTATIKSSTGDWTTNTTLARYDYDLDAAGNVSKYSVTGTQAPNSITDYGYNSFNELCARQAGTTTSTPPACPATLPAFTYDKNGNELTSPGRTGTYNLLDQTTLIAGTSMIYLGAGQDRKVTEGTASLQHNILGLGKRTSGTTTDYFTRDDGGKLVSRRTGTAKVYYFFDALGSVTGHTDDAGAVITRRDYEPYGTPAPAAAGQWGAAPLAGDIANGQFGFAGGYRSVGGMYHFGQRYYDPALMRWTQPDPLDQAGDLREGNRYVYAAADPVNVADPSGTDITLDVSAFLGKGFDASIGVDDEGFPVHGRLGFGAGLGGDVSVSTEENGGGAGVSADADGCAVIRCGSAGVGFGNDIDNDEAGFGTKSSSGWGLGLGGGVSFGVNF
ncbi:MAG TPA: DNRLRE domain-containing protein [Solirubrobacteraceae bacterium]|nr:DNRLRE domain-containing protein [Solirubrobacteraceae bacterium]